MHIGTLLYVLEKYYMITILICEFGMKKFYINIFLNSVFFFLYTKYTSKNKKPLLIF